MDYSAKITTTTPPRQVRHAITAGIEIWWTNRVDRHADGFTVRFNKSHATFTQDHGGTDTAFAWTCTDAHMIIEGVDDLEEWTGTRLIWSVTPAPSGSIVRLTHEGLTPDIACFDVCRRGWQHFFETSLRNHLNGQTAAPEISAETA